MDLFSYFVLMVLAIDHMSFSTAEAQSYNRNISEEENYKRLRSFDIRPSCLKTFDKPGIKVNTTDRLRRLRLRMKASNYDAYLVPSSDEHQSEYVADYDKRRTFISGFSGSSGTVVVLQDIAALWTDGRYYLQAENELDCNWLLMKRSEKETPSLDNWIIGKLKQGSNVGADAKLISYHKWMYLKHKFEQANITFLADGSNLIDDIWNIPQGRTPEPVSHVFIHDVKYTGKTWNEKVEELLQIVNNEGASGTIITALDEIAWLLNIRGQDISYTPVFKAYAFISENSLRVYMKSLKLTEEVEKYLCPKGSNNSCVQVVEYSEAFTDMLKIVNNFEKIVVSASSSYAIVNLIPEEKRILQEEPSIVSRLKVIKNPVEIIGMKNAALKDSVAIVDFIAMLDEEVKLGKHWDEMKAARVLSKYRQEQELNQGESFATISAFGENGAIIHYRPQISTNRNINTKHMYLLDSGGQYLDGTTDITRTFHFGEPTDFEVETYTRVLMGAIDLITMVYPDNVDGTELDIIARRSLYSVGLNYLHSTGHGIGSFLSVHEGPISIGQPSKFKFIYPLKPGMFLSDEPGFYASEKFGIRLETMMMVVKAHTPHQFNNQEYYTFEPISFVPFEPKLVDLHLLSKKQKEWLNWYNMKSRNSVGLELRKQNRKRGFHWLLSKTEYIPIEESTNHASSVNPCYFRSNVFAVVFLIMILL